MPDDDKPADQDDDAELAIPRVPTTPELPPPPDIQYTRPDLGRMRTADTSGALHESSAGKSSRTAGSGITTGQVGRMGAGLSVGFSFAASVIAGLLIGGFVDKHWHTTPWGILIFALLGIAAGFLNLFRLLAALDARDKRK